MERRWVDSNLLTADTLVKAAGGFVKHVTLSWKGAAVGEFCTLVNSATLATSPDIEVFVFATANGCIEINYAGDGKYFSSGIVFNKGATPGDVYCTLQYV